MVPCGTVSARPPAIQDQFEKDRFLQLTAAARAGALAGAPVQYALGVLP